MFKRIFLSYIIVTELFLTHGALFVQTILILDVKFDVVPLIFDFFVFMVHK